MTYNEVLKTAIEQVNKGPCSIVQPEKLLKYLENAENLKNCVTGESSELFDNFYSDFPILRQAIYKTYPIESNSLLFLPGLIQWIKKRIEEYEEKPNSFADLAATAVVSTSISTGTQLFQELAINEAKIVPYCLALARFIEKFRRDLNVKDSCTSIWEKETIEKFANADAKMDFITVAGLWKTVGTCYYPHWLIRHATMFLAYHNLDHLEKATNSVDQSMKAVEIIDYLTFKQRLILAQKTDSEWIRFWVVNRTSKLLDGLAQIGPEDEELLKELLVKYSRNITGWQILMTVLNEHPSRYPALQVALGKALSIVSIEAAAIYLSTLKLSKHCFGYKEVTTCLNSFRSVADLSSKRVFFQQCYEKWESFMNSQISANEHYEKPFVVENHLGVIAYLFEFKSQEENDKSISKILKKITELDVIWFQTISDYLSAFNVCISMIQPYYQAIQCKSKGEFTTNGLNCIPREFKDDKYLKIKYSCSWLS